MERCKGLIGILFGHKYKNFLYKSKPKTKNFEVEGGSILTLSALKPFYVEEQYIICCKRCGQTKNI